MSETFDGEPPEVAMCECGWVEGSFACRVRHVGLLTGWAKADR